MGRKKIRIESIENERQKMVTTFDWLITAYTNPSFSGNFQPKTGWSYQKGSRTGGTL